VSLFFGRTFFEKKCRDLLISNSRETLWAGCDVFSNNTLRRDIKGYSPEVNLAVGVNAWNYKEDSGSFTASLNQTTKSEDDSPLILLYDLFSEKKRCSQTKMYGQ